MENNKYTHELSHSGCDASNAIVNKDSRAGEIVDCLAAQDTRIRVIHHSKNLGYGAAIRTGLANVRYEWVCFTDGDDEYDIYDLEKLIRLRHRSSETVAGSSQRREILSRSPSDYCSR
jgi:glycosyltransferase involved in cell wall biosynthesis